MLLQTVLAHEGRSILSAVWVQQLMHTLARRLHPLSNPFRKFVCCYTCVVFHTFLGLQATNGEESSLGLEGKGSAGTVVLGTRHSSNQWSACLHTTTHTGFPAEIVVNAAVCAASLADYVLVSKTYMQKHELPGATV